ncbi:MAG: hypothetical protein DCC55_28795 [Chloroflexi bacterium]|nr:MAG: hypothetical protein DCC55_28795 [Chloroflexota bacterium]
MPGKIGISVALASLIFHLTASRVWAHPDAPTAPHDLWRAWNWDLLLILGLGVATWRYGTGLAELWQRAGRGHSVTFWRAGAFYAGLFALFVALISPLDALSGVLFSAHMVQHLLLIVVAAPLLAFGCPPSMLWRGLPRRSRRSLARFWRQQPALRAVSHFLTQPSMAWLIHGIALWVWHAPLLYEAAVLNPWIHHLEHTSFFGTALFFWVALIPSARRSQSRYGISVLMVFTTAMHSGLLGALLTFSTTLWYRVYLFTTAAWGVTPLEDQQLAGVIMWVPANLVYLVALLLLLGQWLTTLDSTLRDGAAARTVVGPRTGKLVRME